MSDAKNQKLLLPVELTEYSLRNDCIKSLAIHTYLRFFTNGKIHKASPIFAQLKEVLLMKDPRTFEIHMSKAIDENWIGYCSISGIYFVRGIKTIRLKHNFKNRQASIVVPKDLMKFQLYLAGTMICKEIIDQKFYWEVVQKGKLKKATVKMAVATHSTVSLATSQPAYYGKGVHKIAELLGCKKSRASKIKIDAAKEGYLTSGHRYYDLHTTSKPDFMFRPMYYDQHPHLKGKIRCFPKKNELGEKFYKFVIQQHDEIIPLIKFKKMEKLCHMKLPVEVVIGFQKKLRA